jgi:hypothetical protein
MVKVGTYALPGAYNTYVPNPDATGNLIITFSRNPADFPLPNYVQYRPVDKSTGLYLRIDADEAGRILDVDLKDYVWPDGADAPKKAMTAGFRYEQYRAERYAFPMQLGQLAMEEADWDIEGIHKMFDAQKAMTARTAKVLAVLETLSNWDSDHVAWPHEYSDVYSWEASTSTELAIRKGIQHAWLTIQKSTYGVVKYSDLRLVMSPETAAAIACSQEIVEYVKQQPSAPAIIEGSKWGMETMTLPTNLYGLPIVLENTVKSTNARGATSARSFAMAKGNVFVMARPGSIESVAGSGPSFSTATIFFKEEMTVEAKMDVDQRRWDMRVVDHFDPVMTAPVSGFVFRGVTEDTDSSS